MNRNLPGMNASPRRVVAILLGFCLLVACNGGTSPTGADDVVSLPGPNFDTTGVKDTGNHIPQDTQGQPDAGASVQDVAPSDLAAHPDSDGGTPGTVTRAFGSDQVSAQVVAESGGLRTYLLTTSHGLHCGPTDKKRKFAEPADRPRLRSGNVLFDALYALAVHEAGQNSVEAVSDGAFNQGKPVPCHCYQTGEKWPWAWTRDSAYAMDLGLASLDPQRARDTLLSRLSAAKSKPAVGSQILQDTGTGGSWPVSSDRSVWALGARAVLRQLDGEERTAFAAQVKAALEDSHKSDMATVFEPVSGLYRGEQSFLDWREQSYPAWAANRPADIAMSQALSTNIGHLVARELRRQLSGEAGDEKALRDAIDAGFYLQQRHLYSALRTTGLDLAPAERFDLLGNALAVLHGVADQATAKDVVANYPIVAAGPPVQWPQQQKVPIYHNRAQWPFVTAYWLLASAQVGNAAVASNALNALVRGAALNLSNMENFEFLSGANQVKDGAWSGPVVNSCRQLWSVAGYLAAVHGVIFGMQPGDEGITFKPFVTRALRNDWFSGTNQVHLLGLPYRGRLIDVTLTLPKVAPPEWGALGVANHVVNGKSVPAGTVAASALGEKNVWVAQLADVDGPAGEQVLVKDDGDYRTFFGPHEPKITSLAIAGGQLKVTVAPMGEKDVVFDVFRDGQQVAWGVTDPFWSDPSSKDYANHAYCYSVACRYVKSNNASHHSAPVCWWGANADRVADLGAWRMGGVWSPDAKWSDAKGKTHMAGWGGPQDVIEVAAFVPRHSGKHLMQVVHANVGPLNTGITAAVKRLRVTPHKAGVQQVGVAALPHLGNIHRWGESTLVGPFQLTAGQPVRLTLEEPDLLANMADLKAMQSYSGGAGGGTQPHNRADIAGLRILALEGPEAAPAAAPLVSFDGKDDVQKLKAAQQVVPGIALEPWARFALDWDADYLYLALVSKGFEGDLKAMMIYIQAADTLPAAKASVGMTYLGLTPMLPFEPGHVIGLRSKTDAGDGVGPWAGVYRRQDDWRLQTRLQPGVDMWLAADHHTIAVRIHRAEFASVGAAKPAARKLRLAAHLVHGGAGNEYKAATPGGHTPWKTSATGYFEIDLDGAHSAASWQVK